jgi:DNA-directed RNA polymerase specialized sigma24 family protein
MNKKQKKKIPKIPKKPYLSNKVTEEEFLIVLENISKRLGHKFKFGYHSYEDMKQQAAIFALEGLEKYDKSRPLENFLWTHVRNRLFNYKRDNYQRPDKPCLTCPFYDPKEQSSCSQCTEYDNKNDCALYSSWISRNNSKKNIMKPVGIEDIKDTIGDKDNSTNSVDPAKKFFQKEVIKLLDENINFEHREAYLKFKNGEKINKSDKDKLIKIIQSIIKKQDNE